jgi:hypothetical protein
MQFVDTAIAFIIVALAAFFLLKRFFSKGGCGGCCGCGEQEEERGGAGLNPPGPSSFMAGSPCGASSAAEGEKNNCSGCHCAGRLR